MQEQNTFNEELNSFLVNEQNKVVLTNETKQNFSNLEVSNVEDKKIKQKKPKMEKKKVPLSVRFKLITTFVFLCVVVSSVQNAVYIPVFSDYFAPETSAVSIVDTPYILSINYHITDDAVERILYIDKININENFDNYNSVYVEYINTESGLEGHSVSPKGMIGVPCFVKTKIYPYTSAKYQIKIYVSSSHPENLTYESSKVKDEITYYLVYVHSEILDI